MKQFLMIMMLSVAGAAYAETWRLESENLLISDSDDASQRRHLLGVIADLPSAGSKAGLSLGSWRFNEPAGTEDFDVLRLSYDWAITEKASVFASLHALDGDDWSPMLASIRSVHSFSEQWRIEASAEKGIIDSVAGIRQKLGSETYSASVDWHFSEQWTVVAALMSMPIDDGNKRDGGVLRFIYELPQITGFNLQTRSKMLKSDFNGMGYFSPPVLQEHLLLVGYRGAAFNASWVFSLLAGAGNQKIETEFDENIRNELYYLELNARGWFNDNVGLESKGYCSNTGGPNLGAPDDSYRYCSLLFSIIGSF